MGGVDGDVVRSRLAEEIVEKRGLVGGERARGRKNHTSRGNLRAIPGVLADERAKFVRNTGEAIGTGGGGLV